MLHRKGSELVATYASRKRAAEERDVGALRKRVKSVAEAYMGATRRRKRAVCSLEDRDSVPVDEESIKIKDKYVEFDVVDRRNAKEKRHMKVLLESLELATPKLIKELAAKSRKAGATKVYNKINRGLAVHGLIFSVLGAANYFSKGDNVRGGITVSQSVHTLGGITGINEIVSKIGKHVLKEAAKSLATSLNLEKGLSTIFYQSKKVHGKRSWEITLETFRIWDLCLTFILSSKTFHNNWPTWTSVTLKMSNCFPYVLLISELTLKQRY